MNELADRLKAETRVRIEVMRADLTDPGDLARVSARVSDEPTLNLLVNNAGFGSYGPFPELSVPAINSLIAIHVTAVSCLTHAAVRQMPERGSGGIINMASLLALSGSMPPRPLPYRAVYAGAKSFILTFTQALAAELANSSVRIQVCLPGLVATEFHGRSSFPRPLMQPDDAVDTSLKALRQNEMVCIPGLENPLLIDRSLEAQGDLFRAGGGPTKAARYWK